jgi:hypothetical protein
MATVPNNIKVVNESTGDESPFLNFGGGFALYYSTTDITPDGRIIFGAMGDLAVGSPGWPVFYFRKQKVAGAITLDADWSDAVTIDGRDWGLITDPPNCRVVAIDNNTFRFYYADPVTKLEVYKLSTDGGATWSDIKTARPTKAFTMPAGVYVLNYTEGNTKKWVNHRRGQITCRENRYYYRQLTNA